MTATTNKKVILTIGVGLLALGTIYVIRFFATRPKKNDGTPEDEVTIGSALDSLYNDIFGTKKTTPNVATNYTEQKNAIANDMLYGGLSEQEVKRANELTNLDANNDCLLDGTENREYTDTRTGKKYKGLPTQKCTGEALTKGMDVRTYIAQR
jgi:hypothetical protein